MNLSGKNILFLGSSVTYGSASGGVSFVEIMAEQCGFSFIKEAVSGTTLARLKKLGTNISIDALVCQLSTNDATRNISLSEVEDAIRFIVEYAKCNFNCAIAFYTNPYYESESYAKMVELVNSLAGQYGFCVLDFYSNESMTNEEYAEYMADRIHPTLKGYREWITPKFIHFLENL